MVQMLLHAFRSLGRRPGATLAAVGTLAFGIACYVTFTRVILAESKQACSVDTRGVVMLQGAALRSLGPMSLKEPEMRDLALPGLSDLCRLRGDMVRLGLPEGGSERLQVQQVDAGYFPLTGVRPRLGRPLMPHDVLPGAPPVVVLSYGLWQRVYGGRQDLVGSRIPVNGLEREVVGILPRGHAFTPVTGPVSMLLPLDHASPDGLFVLGRRVPGARTAALENALRIRSEALASLHPETAGWHLVLSRPPNFNDEPLWQVGLQMAAPALLLVLACAGVGSLMVAQAMARQQEDALRAALGAGGGWLMARPMTEAMLLALGGGVVGVAGAWGLLRALGAWLPPSPVSEQLGLDGTTVLMALVATGFCALLCALLPMLRIFRLDLLPLLRGAGGFAARPGGFGMRRTLVACQVGLSTALLLASGQVLHHGWRTLHRDHGLVDRGAVLTQVELPEGASADGKALAVLASDLRASLERLPGVTAVGLGEADPWAPNSATGTLHLADGRACAAWVSKVLGPGWPAAHGLHLLRGRDLDDGALGGCLVNETLARSLGGSQDAVLGQTVRFEDGKVRQVLGVVSDHVRDRRSGPIPEAWHIPEAIGRGFAVTVRGTLPSGALMPSVARVMKGLPSWVDSQPLQTIEGLQRRAVEGVFLQAAILGLLALFGLGLALANLYALLACLVAQKGQVFAVRAALGRTPAGLFTDVVREALHLAAWGVGPGTLIGFGAVRVLAGAMFGLPTFDLPVLFGVLGLMGLASAGAALAPALAACDQNPAQALKAL